MKEKKKISTHFHNDEASKEGSHCICLSVILYYPQGFLEECKSVFKKKRWLDLWLMT